jgi:hypothetical protein
MRASGPSEHGQRCVRHRTTLDSQSADKRPRKSQGSPMCRSLSRFYVRLTSYAGWQGTQGTQAASRTDKFTHTPSRSDLRVSAWRHPLLLATSSRSSRCWVSGSPTEYAGLNSRGTTPLAEKMPSRICTRCSSCSACEKRSPMPCSASQCSGLFHRCAGCAHQPRHTYPC